MYGDERIFTPDELRRVWSEGVRYGEQHPNDAGKVLDEEFTQACEEVMDGLMATIRRERSLNTYKEGHPEHELAKVAAKAAGTFAIHGLTENDLKLLEGLSDSIGEKVRQFRSARPVGEAQPRRLRFTVAELQNIQRIVFAHLETCATQAATKGRLDRIHGERFLLWGKVLNALADYSCE